MTDILLTTTEEQQLSDCESIIEHGLQTFYEVGSALMTIRDHRLYRITHSTFEEYCRERWHISRPRAYQLIDAADVHASLSTIVDKLPETESQARALVRVEPEERAAVWTQALDLAEQEDQRVTARHIEQVVTEHATLQELLLSSKSNEWYTLPEYIEAARTVMGGIDLDPASSEAANRTVQAVRYYTQEDDGLSQPWYGRVWLNPPYGKRNNTTSNQLLWSSRLIQEYTTGNVTEAVLLVNAVTGNKWFCPLKQYPICFPDERLDFMDGNTSELSKQPTHSNALVYFGRNVATFVQVFEQFGPVMGRLAVTDHGVRWTF
jgi:hypothetical protein